MPLGGDDLAPALGGHDQPLHWPFTQARLTFVLPEVAAKLAEEHQALWERHQEQMRRSNDRHEAVMREYNNTLERMAAEDEARDEARRRRRRDEAERALAAPAEPGPLGPVQWLRSLM